MSSDTDLKNDETWNNDPTQNEQEKERTTTAIAIPTTLPKKPFTGGENLSHESHGMKPIMGITKGGIEQDTGNQQRRRWG